MLKQRTNGRALIIGKSDRRVELVQHHLADYFGKIDLLTNLEQLNSLTGEDFAVIVVTDTSKEVLKADFFINLRSLHPRAGLLCLFNHISRQTEKDMRTAGLLFLGSYEHFDDCYGSVLERALRQQNKSNYKTYKPANKPLNANRTAKYGLDNSFGPRFSPGVNIGFKNRIEAEKG